jgi:alkylhydroperoxidase/carboxymuconolactone decarboxylase family protein YurZ
MKAGLDAGLTASDLLELLELILPPAGVPRFIEGIAAWRECCGDHQRGTATAGES